MKKKKTMSFSALIALLIAALFAFTGVLTGCASSTPNTPEIVEPEPVDPGEDPEPEPEPELPAFTQKYNTTARHGYYAEYLGTVKRNIPSAAQDGGLGAYPKYGTTLGLSTEQKTAMLAEADSLCGKNTANASGVFDKLDANGNLLLSDGTPVTDGDGVPRKLYKHTAAAGMYFGDVSDDEPAVIKRITFKPRTYSGSYSITGLYAPAGEIVKVEMKSADFIAAKKNVVFHIGQCLYNGQNNNIWTAKSFNRMPIIMSTLVFNESNSTYNADTDTYTCYIGSFLGGPIYVRHIAATVTMTFSGAVNYRHFVLGYTTEEDFAELSKSTAPYFDLEVWDNGVLQSGPLSCAKNLSYADLFKAAELWEKISLVSTNVRGQGIVFLYDPFVAAGAAVAFPGRASVNCPTGWMANALNYNSFVTSGAWGVMHEYNHNFQGWGLSGGGEVTNNALNLASYLQFTRISAARTLTSSGEGGLSGWNAYTSATWALRRVIAGEYASTNQLCVYATLLHNIGQRDFTLAAKRSGVASYYTDVCNISGYDMTYYFRDMIAQDPGDSAVAAIAEKGYPAFVPVSCVYQTGRSLVNKDGEKRYITTMQPFEIKYGEDFDVDFSPYTVEDGYYKGGSIVLPAGFTYKIKKITSPEHGALTPAGDYKYTYKPDSSGLDSGKIVLTLAIEKDDKAFAVDDVDLVVEFRQTRERNKTMLERTVYTYAEGTLPVTAKAAYEADYAGYTSKVDEDNVNPVQNSNTDIWGPEPNTNAVMEVRGKLYIASDGDYRVALRGRHSCALYLSTDGGKTFEFAAERVNSNSNQFNASDPTTYHDCTDMHAGEWIYFKEVLLVDYASAFTGLGFGRIENEGGVIDENGNMSGTSSPTVNIAYPTAYRNSYEFPKNDFSSEYLFTKTFGYTYDGSHYYAGKGTLVSISGYKPWDTTNYSAGAAELFDDNDNNFIHSAKGQAYDITPEHPFDITVDLGEANSVNTMTIYGEQSRQYQPKDFVLYGGTSKDNMKKLAEVEGATRTGNNVVVNFEACSVRYYRLVCTATFVSTNPAGSKYIAYRCIKFDNIFKLPNGKSLTPADSDICYFGSWSKVNALSLYGSVFVGENSAVCEFAFSGTRFAIGAQKGEEYGGFEVYIDGIKAADVDINSSAFTSPVVYLSSELSAGQHAVKIVCKGRANIETMLYWE